MKIKKNQEIQLNLKRLAPIALLGSIIVLIVVLIHWQAVVSRDLEEGFDLSKNWQVLLSSGEVYTINLPDNKQTFYREKIKNQLSYVNHFITPEICTKSNENGCFLYIGGVFQGAEVFLNEVSVGRQFTRTDLYPATYLLPKYLLMGEGKLNQIRISAYTQDHFLRPGISQGPIGIVSLKTSHSISQKIVGERVILPIVSAAVDLTLGLISLFWILSKNASKNVLYSYLFFCLVSAISMISSTRIPREFFSYDAAYSLHFALVYLMDLSLFHLVVSVFCIKSKYVKLLRCMYIVSVAILFGLFLFLVNWHEFDMPVFQKIHRMGLVGFRKSGLIYLLVCLFSPLILANGLLGLYQSCKYRSNVTGSYVLILLFAVIVPMKCLDLITFFGLLRVEHEIYYIRFYTTFIALAFAYVIWLEWIEKERKAEATLQIGLIAQSVAHDLRAPVASLKVLSRKESEIKTLEDEILKNVAVRIEGISSSLLNIYRSSLQGSDNVNPHGEHRLTYLSSLILELVKSKNYVLSHLDQNIITISGCSGDLSQILCGLDPDKITRTLDNILNNAIEAVSHSENPVISIDLRRRGNFAEITVIDNGKGVTDFQLKRFNLKQFGSSTKISGYGIGLSSVWRNIQEHGGDLQFQRSHTGGTIVRILLPSK